MQKKADKYKCITSRYIHTVCTTLTMCAHKIDTDMSSPWRPSAGGYYLYIPVPITSVCFSVSPGTHAHAINNRVGSCLPENEPNTRVGLEKHLRFLESLSFQRRDDTNDHIADADSPKTHPQEPSFSSFSRPSPMPKGSFTKTRSPGLTALFGVTCPLSPSRPPPTETTCAAAGAPIGSSKRRQHHVHLYLPVTRDTRSLEWGGGARACFARVAGAAEHQIN